MNAIRLSLALAALAFFAAGCGDDAPSGGADTRAPQPVSLAPVAAEPVSGTVRYSASVESDATVQLSTRISGWVEKIHVREGERVRRGQTLVEVRSTDLEARRSQAEAAIAEADVHYGNAKTNLERVERLFASGAATQKELDDMRSAYASAKARRRTAMEMKNEVDAILSYSSLKAPFDGVVTRKMVDVGDLANPGQPVMTVEQVDRMIIVATVPETDVASLKEGMSVAIEAAGVTREAVIDQIIPAAAPRSRQFTVKAVLDNSDGALKSGMFARLLITGGDADTALLVPRSALFRRGQLEGVYLVTDEGKARLRWVRTGAAFGERVEILAGINPGDRVITTGHADLIDGQPVEVRR